MFTLELPRRSASCWSADWQNVIRPKQMVNGKLKMVNKTQNSRFRPSYLDQL